MTLWPSLIVIARAVAESIPPDKRTTEVSDRKSTRLNSSHLVISYAVFCLKKKKFHKTPPRASRTRVSSISSPSLQSSHRYTHCSRYHTVCWLCLFFYRFFFCHHDAVLTAR